MSLSIFCNLSMNRIFSMRVGWFGAFLTDQHGIQSKKRRDEDVGKTVKKMSTCLMKKHAGITEK